MLTTTPLSSNMAHVAFILASKENQRFVDFMLLNTTQLILGITDSEKLGLVRVNFDMVNKSVKVVLESTSESFKKQIESEYSELFKGIGLMDGKISVKLKEGAIPHVEPVRRVPHAMQEPLKKELDKLVDKTLMEEKLHKVDIGEPIEWLNSFVCVKKPNRKIRLCLDPTHLHKWIIRPRHSSKLVDDVLHKLNKAQYLTVVDSTSSFFNHKLDEEFQ